MKEVARQIITDAEWIQAICACLTLILTIIIFILGSKVKTLTDVVVKLEKSNKTAQELLSLEIKSRIYDVQPVFAPFRIKTSSGTYELWVRNRGQKSRNVDAKTIENVSNIRRVVPTIPTVLTNEQLQLNFITTNDSLPYQIELSYQDDYGQTYKQIIKGKGNQYHLSFPEWSYLVE